MGKGIQFKHYLIVLLSVLFYNQYLQAQISKSPIFDWVKQNGISTDGNSENGISVDVSGNSYVTGRFYGTAFFGSIQLKSSEYGDIFIAKYNPDGNCLWAKQAGGSSYSNAGYSIAVDASGNSYVTGCFDGTASFGSIQLTTNAGYGNRTLFIVKYDPDGNCLWAKQAGGSSYSNAGYSVAVDASGNSYITGYFSEVATLDSIQLKSTGAYDILVAKYDAKGNCLWAKSIGGWDEFTDSPNDDRGESISLDSNGNSYVTGRFSGTASFGSITIKGSSSNPFIAKYNTDGNCLWAKRVGGNGYVSEGKGVYVDASGNSYVTGYFKGTTSFDSIQLTSRGASDIFIAKYNSEGNCLWAKQAGGSGYGDETGNGISVDKKGNCYVTGNFYNSASFGSISLTSAGGDDIFIAEYDTDGNCLWVKQAGGSYSDYGKAIKVDAIGNIYVAGCFDMSASFGRIQLTGKSSYNNFTAKLVIPELNLTSPIGNEIWGTNTTHNITWNSKDDGNIKIEITTDNGANWISLVNSISASLGSYTFTVPPFPMSQGCKIRLTSLSHGNISQSASVFTITSDNVTALCVTSPNTSIKWNSNSQHNITWSMNGNVENAKLEYTTNNGLSWIVITNSTPAASLIYTWTIPNSPSALCRIRISDALNSSLNDVSDNLFSIAQITITSPNGKEIWKSGSSNNITWTSATVSNAKVSYSTDNGASWKVITSSAPASAQSYVWTAPDLTSLNCKIKIEDASDPTLFDLSDNTFTIWQPVVSSFTPTTGQITQTLGSTNIDLSAFVVVADAITVTFYPFEAPVSGTLPGGIVGSSPYYWHISSPSASIINGIVGVPISALTDVTDATKLVWLKRSNSGDAWTNIGGIVSGGKLLSTVAFNSFSEFAIGTSDAINPVSVEIKNDVPVKYSLGQNYPNPFNPSTVINYSLPVSSEVALKVFDMLGKEVATLVRGVQSAGRHSITFNSQTLPSGIYIYKIYAGSFMEAKKMLLLK